MNERPITISITTGTVFKILFALAVVWSLFYLKDVVLIVLTAIVLASAIEPAAQWFVQRKIPRVASVLLVYLIFFGSFFVLFYFFLPPVLAEMVNFASSSPKYLDVFNNTTALANVPILGSAAQVDQTAVAQFVTQISDMLRGLATNALTTAAGVFGGVISFIFIIVFSFYFAVQETGVEDFLRIITPKKQERYVVDLWRRSQQKIGLWMQGQVLLGLLVGILVYLGLTIIGVKYALVLAVTAALFELIPVFGPTLSAVPAVLIAFVDGGVSLGLVTLVLFIIIQQFENHLVYPLVVTKVVGVPPLLVILALIVGAKLVGFLGVLLSVPAAAAIQEFVNDLQHRRHFVLGEDA